MGSSAGARVVRRLRAVRDARAATTEAAEGIDSGFTLIELMVVLLVVAILLAIAIPTFLSTSNQADDTSASANLHNEMISAKGLYIEQQGYDATGAVVSTLNSSNPSLTATASKSTAMNVISVATYESDGTTAATSPDNGTILVLAAYSPHTATCWVGIDNISTDTAAAPSGTTWGSFGATDASACDSSGFAGGGGLSTIQG